uniref:Uncharacterized protein n=1 Tax=uncultured gamma proteobacterium HF0010_16J05 TaxID=710981 RepID=E0XR55_9GAMM|nr:hypothetical protein [uncultured gamma proteobacterium HF0010_16J05]
MFCLGEWRTTLYCIRVLTGDLHLGITESLLSSRRTNFLYVVPARSFTIAARTHACLAYSPVQLSQIY